MGSEHMELCADPYPATELLCDIMQAASPL